MKFVISTKSGMYFTHYDNIGVGEFSSCIDNARVFNTRYSANYHSEELSLQGFDVEIIKI